MDGYISMVKGRGRTWTVTSQWLRGTILMCHAITRSDLEGVVRAVGGRVRRGELGAVPHVARRATRRSLLVLTADSQ